MARKKENAQDMHDTEEMNTSCPHCSGKHKDREDKEKKDLINRLKRIEGQVRGVEGMLENDAYCTDILVQVSAITSALNSFNKVLLANHMKSCVADNIRNGNDEIIDELVVTLQKLMK
ncbi:DNA-binding transcriptional regulator, FrmR family [Butyrivibrio sp. INlla21]|nr:DNA-binding transcriptional regulator, FrmR family [Butyrivibrio sp. INlla21]